MNFVFPKHSCWEESEREIKSLHNTLRVDDIKFTHIIVLELN